MPTEEYAIVLDYLPEGKADMKTPGYKRERRVAQIIGEAYYSLLEVVIREEFTVNSEDRVYIGTGVREKIHHISRRINYDELTSTGKAELDYALEKLVKAQEQKFVHWFNECGSLTTRLHRLELLPSIGKKHMWEITKIRRGKKFESFQDISERVKLLPDPEKLVIKRIIWELRGEDDKGKQIKYKIFVGVPMLSGEKPAEKKEETKAEAPKEEKVADASPEE